MFCTCPFAKVYENKQSKPKQKAASVYSSFSFLTSKDDRLGVLLDLMQSKSDIAVSKKIKIKGAGFHLVFFIRCYVPLEFDNKLI